MRVPRPRSRALCVAVLYIGVVAVLGLAAVLGEDAAGGTAAPHVLAFPGSVVVTVLLFLASAVIDAGDTPVAPVSAVAPMVLPVAGALVNVAGLWAAVSFARLFMGECRAARKARRGGVPGTGGRNLVGRQPGGTGPGSQGEDGPGSHGEGGAA